MNSLLAELENKSIITADAVARFKSHIASKSPDASVSRRAVILADALNKVLDQKLSNFGEEHIKKLKRILLEHAVKKQEFEILCSDAFQAAVELKEFGEDFFDGLEAWLSANLDSQLSREQLVGVVLESHRLMELRPVMDVADTIAAAEAIIAAAERTEQIAPVFEQVARTGEVASADLDATIFEGTSADYAATRLKVITRKTSARMEAAETETEAAVEPMGMDNTVRMAASRIPAAFEAGSASYAAARLKAISRKTSAHMEPAESKMIAGIEAANRCGRAREPYPVLGYFSEVLVAKSGYKRHLNKWRRFPVAAAAAVLLVAGLAFGIWSISISSVNTSRQMATANQADNAYEYTVLLEEDVAAGINSSANKKTLRMKATAYDLSVESCGKKPGEPGYGFTSSGSKAKVGRTVAVDPEVIPLGSRLMINFPEEYSYLDGVYIAEDTGRLIKGSSIDIFFGEDDIGSTNINDEAMEFGVRYVDVKILGNSSNDAS